MRSICDILKLTFHFVVLVTVAAPLFIVWGVWRLFTSLAALPHHVYQKVDDLVFHFWQKLVIILLEDVAGCKVLLHGDLGDVIYKKERALYIVNHQSFFDWIAVNMLAERTGCAGTLRYIVKQSVQSFPLLGFYFHQHGCIYINRQQLNAFKMKRGLYYLQNKNIRSSVVLFPEGSRYIPGKEEAIKKSTEFARSLGLPVPRQHLMPHTNGFVITVQEMRENLDAVYSVTIIYGGTKMPHGGRNPSPGILVGPLEASFDWLRADDTHVTEDKQDFTVCSNIHAWLKHLESTPLYKYANAVIDWDRLTQSPQHMFTGRCGLLHMHVRRTPIDRVPEDDRGLKKFIFDAFYEQDALLTAYYGSEETPAELRNPVSIPCEHIQFVLIATAFMMSLFLLTPTGRSTVWKTWLYGSIFGYSWLGMNSVA